MVRIMHSVVYGVCGMQTVGYSVRLMHGIQSVTCAGRPTFSHEIGDAEPSLQHPLPKHRKGGAIEGQGAAHQHIQYNPHTLQDQHKARDQSQTRVNVV